MKKLLLFSVNALYFFHQKRPPIPEEPKRILICNLASLGDVVISTTVLPVLKKRYPKCEIGFLTSKKAAATLKNHPLVTHLHTMDQWYGNRELGLWRAALRHFIDFQRAAREIRRYGYDLAIDLYPEFIQSAIPLLSWAKIPIRIARPSQGYTCLITHGAPFIDASQYMGQNHLKLLKVLGIDASLESPFPSYFHSKPKIPRIPKEYVVLHMGTAVPAKKWDTKKWIEVVRNLIERGETVLLTGSGAEEAIDCAHVSKETGCLNFCNQLSWADFSGLIQHAKLLISVDSASIHIASSTKVPTMIVFSGINPIPLWKPPSSLSRAFTNPVPCSPCLLKKGCSHMSCIRKIEATDLLKNRLSLHNATL